MADLPSALATFRRSSSTSPIPTLTRTCPSSSIPLLDCQRSASWDPCCISSSEALATDRKPALHFHRLSLLLSFLLNHSPSFFLLSFLAYMHVLSHSRIRLNCARFSSVDRLNVSPNTLSQFCNLCFVSVSAYVRCLVLLSSGVFSEKYRDQIRDRIFTCGAGRYCFSQATTSSFGYVLRDSTHQ
jgi:hypothetical protein